MTKKMISVIHIAKSQLGLSDDQYRTLLREIGGVESSRDLSDAGFEAIMFQFTRMGFKSTWNRRNYGYRRAMASPRQVAFIRSMWEEFTDDQGDEAALGKWLSNKFGVSSLRFLPAEKAQKVIGALKAMNRRHEKHAAA